MKYNDNMNKKCSNCQKSIEVPSWKFKDYKGRPANKHFFCSRKCYEEFWAKKILPGGKKHYNWKGGNIKSICRYCGDKFEVRRRGKDRKYAFCSKKCVGKWLKGKYTKKENPNWKNSPVQPGRQDMNSMEWKRAIYKKDKYKCRKCKNGKNLNAHHLKNYKEFPELRYKISNGITFCLKCHRLFHKIYGKTHNTKEQVAEFLKTP